MTTEPTAPAGDRLFALIASIPGSGTADWCDKARALLDEVRAEAVSAGVAPATDQTTLRDRIAAALIARIKESVLPETTTPQFLGGTTSFFAATEYDLADVALAQMPATVDRASVYAEVAGRLAADAEHGDKEGLTRIYRRSAARQVRTWADELAGEVRQDEAPRWVCKCPAGLCGCGHHDEARQDPTPDGEPATAPGRAGTVPTPLGAAAVAYQSRDGRFLRCLTHAPDEGLVGVDWFVRTGLEVDGDDSRCSTSGCGTDVLAEPSTTAYGNGKGRAYCLTCAPTVGADVPLTIDDVDHWELCPSCGRHIVDVARDQPQTTED
ncbi:hypothetical protein ACIQI8_27200 [Streptomyces sp. NPDC092369]|uniref:hypothetical protein n=1 Tax=Streptomyces sp. NPDC092369 TaxID=3366015 RepID=UPI00380F7A8D